MNDDDITAGDHERRPTPATIEIYEPWRERFCPPDVPVGTAVVELQYRRPAVVGWNVWPESKTGAHIGINDPFNGTPFGSRTPSMLRLPDLVHFALPATVTHVGVDESGRLNELVVRDEESGALWPWLRDERDEWGEPMEVIKPVTRQKNGLETELELASGLYSHVAAPGRGSYAHYFQVFQPWMPDWLGPNESDVDFQNRGAHIGPYWRRMVLRSAHRPKALRTDFSARLILGKRPTPP